MPTIRHQFAVKMVGTLRFAHPTKVRSCLRVRAIRGAATVFLRSHDVYVPVVTFS